MLGRSPHGTRSRPGGLESLLIPEASSKGKDMNYTDIVSEFEQSIEDYERTLQVTIDKLRFLSEVDSAYLGHHYKDRIDELRRKVASVEEDKDETVEAFRNIGRFVPGAQHGERQKERGGRRHG